MRNKNCIYFFAMILWANLSFSQKAIVFLGAPGAGKGTQTILLKNYLAKKQKKFEVVSVGNLLRNETLNETELHEIRKRYSDNSQVKEMLKFYLVFHRIKNLKQNEGFIFDSWPKTIRQVDLLNDVVLREEAPLVIELDVSDETISNRLPQRMVCPNLSCQKSYGEAMPPPNQGEQCECGENLIVREADGNGDFFERVKRYRKSLPAIKEVYGEKNYQIHTIAGEGDPQAIHAEISALVDSYLEN